MFCLSFLHRKSHVLSWLPVPVSWLTLFLSYSLPLQASNTSLLPCTCLSVFLFSPLHFLRLSSAYSDQASYLCFLGGLGMEGVTESRRKSVSLALSSEAQNQIEHSWQEPRAAVVPRSPGWCMTSASAVFWECSCYNLRSFHQRCK